ncbi:MAG: hypothetical protein KGM43_04855, partial [Planctomycetota bacterium]|nr:hypothetical protein [Planctomycetota bacterium]
SILLNSNLNGTGGAGALATSGASAGGLIGASGATSTATDSPNVSAGVAGGTLNAAEDISVAAQALNFASSTANGNAFGVVGGGLTNANADANGATSAAMNASVVNGTGNGAANLTVRAIASDNAYSLAQAATGGLLSGQLNQTQTTVQPNVSASVAGPTIKVASNINVAATDNPQGNANTQGVSVGFASAGVSQTNDTVSPTVNAYIASGTDVHAGGNVAVVATQTPQSTAGTPNYQIASVNPNANTLYVANNGLQTGQIVLYDNQGNTPIAGLTGETQGSNPNGMRAYNVINVLNGNTVDPNNIQLGDAFSGAASTGTGPGVNSANSTINTSGVANLKSGDQVQYQPVGGAAPIGGLTPGGIYYVELVSPTSIRLTNTYDEAVNPQNYLKNFTKSAIGPDHQTITLPSNGFTLNEPVTFQPQAQPQQFSSRSVNVTVAYDASGNPTLTPAPGANNIFVDNNPFQTGDTILYTVTGANAPIGGLINNHTYQVVRQSDANLIQLRDFINVSSLTFAQNGGGDTITRNDGGNWANDGFSAGQQITISGTAQNNGTFTIKSLSGSLLTLTVSNSVTAESDANVNVLGPVVALTPDTSPTGQSVIHNLSVVAVGGLVNTNTYYVVNPTANTFQLATTPNGTPITLTTNGVGSSTVFQVGPQGIDVKASSGSQTLAIVLPSTTVSGTQQLLGPGGVSLSVVVPVVGNGISTATSHGSSGGAIAVSSNSANLTENPTVSAFVSSTLLQAGGDIAITSNSTTSNAASTDNGTGGLVASGTTYATTNQYNSNQAYVGGGAMIEAGGNFVLISNSMSGSSVNANSSAGGLIGDVHSNTTANINFNTTSTVQSGATVTALNLLEVSSNSGVTANSSSSADGAGFGAAGYANTNGGDGIFIGNGGGTTQTEIGSGASLQGGEVILNGAITSLYAQSHAEATGAGFYGQGESDSEIGQNITNNVLVDANARVTGLYGVDMVTPINNVNTYARADATAEGLFGFVSATSNNNATYNTYVTTAGGSVIAAGPRNPSDPNLAHPGGFGTLALYVNTSYGPVAVNADNGYYKKALAAGGGHGGPSLTENQAASMNGNVVLLAGQAPLLIIDAAGNVAEAVNASASLVGNTINVADIAAPVAGQADVVSNNINGSGGNWDFRQTYQSVTIINNSNDNLQINNIAVASNSVQPSVVLNAPGVGLTFTISHSITTTPILIENNGTGNVLVNGTINNPISSTTITNSGGGILATNPRGVPSGDGHYSLIVTNILNASADGAGASIGSSATRLNVNLVQSYDAQNAVARPTQVFASAGRDVYLDLMGVLRQTGSIPFNVYVDSIVAGNNADVLMQPSVQQTAVSGNVGAISISTPQAPFSGSYYNFFQPDSG